MFSTLRFEESEESSRGVQGGKEMGRESEIQIEMEIRREEREREKGEGEEREGEG